MIPAKRKVNHGLFEPLIKKGRTYPSEYFSLRVFFSSTAEPAKFSVVAPKKLEKSAVKRNAIKRRVYSALHPLLPVSKPGSLCAFFIKKKVEARLLPQLSSEIMAALKKAGVVT